MNKIKLLKISSITLLSTMLIATPLLVVSCSDNSQLAARQKFKEQIRRQGLDITQEAIDILGEELYRQENGLHVLDVSHWGLAYSNQNRVFNAFDKPVNKMIFNLDYESKPEPIGWGAQFFPKNNVLNQSLNTIYNDFSLRGTFELASKKIMFDGYKIGENEIITDENIKKMGAFPFNAFTKVSKLVFNTDNFKVDHAAFPNAFKDVEENDPNLVEHNGKKYPGIIARKNDISRAISSIIPFSYAIGDGTEYVKCLEKISDKQFNVKPWPAFTHQWGNKDQGFYFETLEHPGVRIFITNTDDIDHLLRGSRIDYVDYAKKNPGDPHIQENYQNLLKIYKGADGKVSWSEISTVFY